MRRCASPRWGQPTAVQNRSKTRRSLSRQEPGICLAALHIPVSLASPEQTLHGLPVRWRQCPLDTDIAPAHPWQTRSKQCFSPRRFCQRAAETLDQGYGAGVCRSLSVPGFLGQMRGNGAIDDAQHLAHDRRLAGKTEGLPNIYRASLPWRLFPVWTSCPAVQSAAFVHRASGGCRSRERQTKDGLAGFQAKHGCEAQKNGHSSPHWRMG